MRAASPAWLNVVARSAAGTVTAVGRAPRDRDFVAKIELDGLVPGTRYEVRGWFTRSPDRDLPPRDALRATFVTAPEPTAASPITFAWGGDVGGQNVCRHTRRGYPVFRTLAQLPLSFFVGLGDMIYADGTCLAVGGYGNAQIAGTFPRSTRLAHMREHWAYNRADPGSLAFLAGTPYLAVWDDHEIANDIGPMHDRSSADPAIPLLPIALRSFLEWNPVAEHPTTPNRLYRSIRWGRHLEIILLDTRQYRDPNYAPDSATWPKTMLGREQRAWLDARLRSDATWKVVASSVPMAVPTGQDSFGRDGWADEDGPTGFERELVAILRTAHASGVRNMLWITTDAHFAAGFRHRPFPEDPAFVVHEVITGPMNAGLFPSMRLDTTLRPERLFHFGPEDAGAVRDYETALSWMTFGQVRIDPNGQLTVSVHRVANADEIFRQTLTPRE